MSIKQKRCKSGCGRWPVLGYNGHCLECSSPEVREAKFAKLKAQREASQARQRAKRSIRTLAPTKLEDKDAVRRQVELNEWFRDRHNEMTGICAHCGGKTTKGNSKYWKFSIAHILEKKNFDSIGTHPLNFIELCHFDNSCHTNFDNKMLEPQDMKCWAQIQERFEKMYPMIAKDEHQFIPDVLLQSL